MTFFVAHEWCEGAHVNGARLATCKQCGTLRVTLRSDSGETSYYIRRIADEDERVRQVSPPCVAPSSGFRAPW